MPEAQPAAAQDAEARVQACIEEYRRTMQSYQGQAKPDWSAFKQLKSKYLPSTPIRGHIPGIKPGDTFKGRGELAITGVHPDLMPGISYRANVPDGAFSIVLSGGYSDDDDRGSTLYYTGSGGNQKGKQVKDQEWTEGNQALRLAHQRRSVVRVSRCVGRDADGSISYQYSGLYMVVEATKEKSKDGPKICRFKLEGVPGEHLADARHAVAPPVAAPKPRDSQPSSGRPAGRPAGAAGTSRAAGGADGAGPSSGAGGSTRVAAQPPRAIAAAAKEDKRKGGKSEGRLTVGMIEKGKKLKPKTGSSVPAAGAGAGGPKRKPSLPVQSAGGSGGGSGSAAAQSSGAAGGGSAAAAQPAQVPAEGVPLPGDGEGGGGAAGEGGDAGEPEVQPAAAQHEEEGGAAVAGDSSGSDSDTVGTGAAAAGASTDSGAEACTPVPQARAVVPREGGAPEVAFAPPPPGSASGAGAAPGTTTRAGPPGIPSGQAAGAGEGAGKRRGGEGDSVVGMLREGSGQLGTLPTAPSVQAPLPNLGAHKEVRRVREQGQGQAASTTTATAGQPGSATAEGTDTAVVGTTAEGGAEKGAGAVGGGQQQAASSTPASSVIRSPAAEAGHAVAGPSHAPPGDVDMQDVKRSTGSAPSASQQATKPTPSALQQATKPAPPPKQHAPSRSSKAAPEQQAVAGGAGAGGEGHGTAGVVLGKRSTQEGPSHLGRRERQDSPPPPAKRPATQQQRAEPADISPDAIRKPGQPQKRGRPPGSTQPSKAAAGKQVAKPAPPPRPPPAPGLIIKDLAGGRERFPIPVVNHVDQERLDPSSFTYCTSYMISPRTWKQVDQTLRKEHIRMLEYADPRPGVGPRKVPQGQSPPSDRPPDALVAFNLGLPEWCGLQHMQRMHDLDTELQKAGKLPVNYEVTPTSAFTGEGLLMSTEPCGLHECGQSCKAQGCVQTRHAFQGVAFQVEVFKTNNGRGWGVRTRETIPAGAFVMSYIGELRLEHDRVDPDSDWCMDLDMFVKLKREIDEIGGMAELDKHMPPHKLPPLPKYVPSYEDPLLMVDAGRAGNVARFLNHSCAPNLTKQTVFAGQARSTVCYVTAFFAETEIQAFKVCHVLSRRRE